MAMTSSQLDHCELEGGEEDMKPRVAAVRRNLFGPVDHQQLQQDFQRLLCMSVELAKQRWNFDFQNERPVAGEVEWEEMHWQDAPAFYRSCVVRAGTTRRRLEAPTKTSGSLACSTVAAAREEYLELRARAAFRGAKLEKRMSAPLGVKQRQATITAESIDQRIAPYLVKHKQKLREPFGLPVKKRDEATNLTTF
ncbi:hypothetical protein NFI96_001481 [Prochilodus magdalenae]|nr:hypothetical protein NFI96_001481 [Prochilodus magdalenae]